jgi:hypothetical protein
MRIFKSTLALLLTLLACSCAGIELEPYNNSKMASFKLTQELEQKIAVSISSRHDINKISCRSIINQGGIDLYMPKKQTYTSYIQAAFVKTLTEANKYDSKSKLILSGNITKVDFDTIKGSWNIAGKFKINNKTFSIDKLYNFPTSWETQTACDNAAKSFGDVVTQFLLDTLEEAL